MQTSTCLQQFKGRHTIYSSRYSVSLWTLFFFIHVSVVCSIDATRFGLDSDFSHEAGNDLTRENIYLYALTGHHFNRSITEEIKKFDSTLLSADHKIKVHFPSHKSRSTRWMILSDEDTLQGVPLPYHEGIHSFYVTIYISDTPNRFGNTLPCTVEVLPEEAVFASRHDHRMTKIDAPFMCPHNEPITMATIILESSSESINSHDRLRTVIGVEKYFNVPAKDIVFCASSKAGTANPILSGAGNIRKIGTDSSDFTRPISISWPLGCSSDIIGDIPNMDKLETSSLDGSLAEIIGFDVREWSIRNVLPQQKRLRRSRRRTDQVPSSGAIVIPTSTIPTGQNPTRTQALSGSSTISMPLSTTNQPPMELFGVPPIEAIVGTYLEYQISPDAFYDMEDGLGDQLDLELYDGETLSDVNTDGTWIRFDTKSQIIYGVPNVTKPSTRSLVLMARDSGGKTASIDLTITVNISAHVIPVTHNFTFILSEAPEFHDDNSFLASFGRKLVVAMAKVEQMPGEIVFVKTDFTKSGLKTVVWFDSSMSSKRICNSLGLTKAANIMIGDDAPANIRNKPAKEFANKFRPEYKLKGILIKLMGPCKNYITTTTTTTTTTLTTITTTISTATTTSTPATTIQPPTITSKPSTTVTTEKTTLLTATMPTTSPTSKMSTSSTQIPDKTTSLTTTLSPDKPPIVNLSTSPATTSSSITPIHGETLPTVEVETGKVTRFSIPNKIKNDIETRGAGLSIESAKPNKWIYIDPKSTALYIMPTSDEVTNLSQHNSTHKIWSGSIQVKSKEKVKMASYDLNVVVRREKKAKNSNHKFTTEISNHNFKDFGAFERMKFIGVINDVFEDEKGGNVYLSNLTAGSVIISWYNDTLGTVSPCPVEELTELGMKIFNKDKLKNEVIERFMKNNFTITTMVLKRMPSCTTKSSPTDVAVAGANGKTTTTIIIVVVILCLLILIAILVIKCRSGLKKNVDKKKKPLKEEASVSAGNLDAHDTPRIKKGVPIIFQDEIALEADKSTDIPSTTPLISRKANGSKNHSSIPRNDLTVHEETPFSSPATNQPMTPPTPIMPNRPPPPYSSKDR